MKAYYHIAAFLIIVVISIFFHTQDFRWIIDQWQNNPYYQHGFYVFIVTCLFGIYRLTQVEWGRLSSRSPFWFLPSTFWWVIAAILYWSGRAISSESFHYYLRTLAFLFMFRGLIGFWLRERVAKGFSFPIFYPVLAIPFPHFEQISMLLREATMYLSTLIFNIFGVASYDPQSGLIVRSVAFPIDQAFTGIESLILLVTFVVLIVYIFESREILQALVVSLVLPLAFIGCSVRVLVFLILGYFFNENIAKTYWDSWATPTFYLVAFLLIGLAWMALRYFIQRKYLKQG
ncbi:MAG: exosortase/archaeosortase family protein [Deltaproteobacteria bacterium]|nr:exosortase/archaeosortase family protein [Deltaproteobacteria bacterium]